MRFCKGRCPSAPLLPSHRLPKRAIPPLVLLPKRREALMPCVTCYRPFYWKFSAYRTRILFMGFDGAPPPLAGPCRFAVFWFVRRAYREYCSLFPWLLPRLSQRVPPTPLSFFPTESFSPPPVLSSRRFVPPVLPATFPF